MNGYMYNPSLEVGKPVGKDGAAVLPAWRKAYSHTLFFTRWELGITDGEQLALRKDFAERVIKPVRDITPGMVWL